MVALKRRQRQILDTIISYVDEHGFAPTIHEICTLTGAGTNLVWETIRRLVELGYISRPPRVSRSIILNTPREILVRRIRDALRMMEHGAAPQDVSKQTGIPVEVVQILKRIA